MYYDAQLSYLLLIVGIHLNNHVYHISIKEMSLSFSHSLSARVLSHEADRADIIHLYASGISRAKWQVPNTILLFVVIVIKFFGYQLAKCKKFYRYKVYAILLHHQ